MAATRRRQCNGGGHRHRQQSAGSPLNLSLVSILAPAANMNELSPWHPEAAAVTITIAFAAAAAVIVIIIVVTIFAAVVATAGGLAAAVAAGGCCIFAHAEQRWQLFRGSSATEREWWWHLRHLGCEVGGGSLAAGADLHRCCRCRFTASAPPPPPPPPLHRFCHCRTIIMVWTTKCII